MNFLLSFWHDENWQSSYSAADVALCADMIRRNYKKPCKIYCVTDKPEGLHKDIIPLPMYRDFCELGHCYRRLSVFAPDFGDVIPGKFCSVDLDCVITGDLTDLLDNSPDFAICKDYQPPQPYNGSFFVLTPGARPQVFEQFKADPKGTIERAAKEGFTACDQAVIAYILKNEKTFSESDGFYSYKYNIKRQFNGNLPKNARFIAFHGHPKPSEVNLTWIKRYYRPSKRAIVLGGASGVWQELESLGNIKDTSSIFAINDSISAYSGKIDYAITLHPEKMPKWKQARENNGYDMAFKSVGYGRKGFSIPKETDYYLDYWYQDGVKCSSGSSGLFAVKAALELGFDEVILCGVPMDGGINIHRGKEWADFKGYRDAWLEQLPRLKGRVFSQSGWTKELLGSFI